MIKTRKLYLPGTNKNVGYLYDNKTLCIYKRHIKYFPFQQPLLDSGECTWARIIGPVIFMQKEKKVETLMQQLYSWAGYFYNVEKKTYDFFNCTFKTPDNLDVIEMAYLYKHWKKNEKA